MDRAGHQVRAVRVVQDRRRLVQVVRDRHPVAVRHRVHREAADRDLHRVGLVVLVRHRLGAGRLVLAAAVVRHRPAVQPAAAHATGKLIFTVESAGIGYSFQAAISVHLGVIAYPRLRWQRQGLCKLQIAGRSSRQVARSGRLAGRVANPSGIRLMTKTGGSYGR